ncbi:restriction endonuclease subunit S [Klebsiella pneumoniae]|uniref:restriction endonuclease subunit S n=1 Tax=Klebsiella pneumoniae TaxID=573 RepID=UPI001CA4CBEA|nr:restriction endonuclease subunit S [Klebsiella pneumoniae]MBW5507641.1 restriction endonuclease subunit S [Klebsiella pneumoniae]
MSEMSYLEKLLDGAEVEWKPLREVCDFKNGFAFKSNLFKETGLPIVRITNIDGFNVNLDEVKYFSPNDYKEDISSFEVSMGDIVIAMSGATTGKVGFYKNETRCYLNQRVGKFVPKRNLLNNKYLYHFLLLNTEAIYILAGGGAQPNLSSNALMSKLLIPIPSSSNPEKSLAIQSEIVRILDKFTALTAELTAGLTAELTMRKKQYNYYRDQLLSFKEGEVEWKTLGEVATFRRGTAITQKQTTPGDIPVVANGPTPTYFHSESNRQDETIVIARSGAYAGYVSFWNQPIFLTDAFSVHPNLKIVKPKFLYYVLQNKQEHIQAMKKGAGVPHVRVKEFESYDVPIPPLAEQVRIVTILDKFDTLTNSITEGLPREIELRQKQYEYYRDMLFSFPKPDVVEA